MSEASGEQRARQLLSEVPLLDGHNDLPWALQDAGCAGLDGTDLSQPVSFTQTDLPRLAAGGGRRPVLVGVRARDAGR
jgi:membrane dipeptidase